MSVRRYALVGKPAFHLDVIGGNYRILTHSQPELLMDTRRTHNQSVLPEVLVSNDRVQIGKQPLLKWFRSKLGVECKLIVPEDCALHVKMFSGELSIGGLYRSVNARLRYGNVHLLGPHFQLQEPSVINIVNGSLHCHQLQEAGFDMPWSDDKIGYVENQDGVQLRVRLHFGELDFS